MSSTKGEYSTWTAATCAILQARRSVLEETEDSPMYLILPSLENLRQKMIRREAKCLRLQFRQSSHGLLNRRIGISMMHVI